MRPCTTCNQSNCRPLSSDQSDHSTHPQWWRPQLQDTCWGPSQHQWCCPGTWQTLSPPQTLYHPAWMENWVWDGDPYCKSHVNSSSLVSCTASCPLLICFYDICTVLGNTIDTPGTCISWYPISIVIPICTLSSIETRVVEASENQIKVHDLNSEYQEKRWCLHSTCCTCNISCTNSERYWSHVANTLWYVAWILW